MTENGNRTICSNCGYFMYRVANQNIEKRSNTQRALDDAKIAGKSFWKIFRIVWIVIVIIVINACTQVALLNNNPIKSFK